MRAPDVPGNILSTDFLKGGYHRFLLFFVIVCIDKGTIGAYFRAVFVWTCRPLARDGRHAQIPRNVHLQFFRFVCLRTDIAGYRLASILIRNATFTSRPQLDSHNLCLYPFSTVWLCAQRQSPSHWINTRVFDAGRSPAAERFSPTVERNPAKMTHIKILRAPDGVENPPRALDKRPSGFNAYIWKE